MASNSFSWYSQLVKPSWAPPAWLFGPVWTVLYAIIAVSYGTVFYLAYKRKIPRQTVIPFAGNLLTNLAFTPLQFGLRSNVLAAIDILLVLMTILWSFSKIWPHRRWVALVNIPYLLWVAFATVLQLTITWLNFNK